MNILLLLLQSQHACMGFRDAVFLASWVEKPSSWAPAVSRYVWSPEAFFCGRRGRCFFLLCLHKLKQTCQHICAARNQTTVLDGLMEKKHFGRESLKMKLVEAEYIFLHKQKHVYSLSCICKAIFDFKLYMQQLVKKKYIAFQ